MFYYQFVRNFFFFFVVSLGFLFARVGTVPLYIATVTGDRVNLRSEPDLESEILGTAFEGQKLFVTKNEEGWVRVFLPETVSFWIHSKLVRKTEGENRGLAWKDAVHLRVEPNINSFSVGLVYKNQEFIILEERFDWYRVKVPKKSFSAWISRDFIQKIIDYSVYLRRAQEKKIDQIYQKLEGEYLNHLLFSQDNERLSFFLKQYKTFIIQYPKSKHLDSVQKRVNEIVRKQMNFSWFELEKNFELRRDQDSKRNWSLLKSYQNFQKIYPKNPYAQTVQERIAFFLTQSNKNKGKKDNMQTKVFFGFVQDVGVLWNRPARYKLVNNKKIVCFLRSKTINLSRYVSHFVKVGGTIFFHKGYKNPVLETSDVIVKNWKGQ